MSEQITDEVSGVPPIIRAYLDDLAKTGLYGLGRSGVIRTFIEMGIRSAIEHRIITIRHTSDYR